MCWLYFEVECQIKMIRADIWALNDTKKKGLHILPLSTIFITFEDTFLSLFEKGLSGFHFLKRTNMNAYLIFKYFYGINSKNYFILLLSL